MKKMRWLAALLLLFAFVGAACGGDDDDSTVGSDSWSTTADDGGSATAPPELKITASEDAASGSYKFDVPATVPGGVVKVTLDNTGGKEVHDFQLVKLDGHKLDELLPQIASDTAPLESWLKQGAGAGSTPPGQSTSAVFKLEPNTEYAFFCTESNDKGVSHAQHGMAGSFTTGDDSGATMPKGTATIETTEYKFKVDGLKAGKNSIAFTNKGSMLHHVGILPFMPGKTLDDLKKALASDDQSGPPPVDFEKSTFSAVAGIGDTIVYDVDLPPGHYAILCFMPDPGTAGPPHAIKGMVDEFTIS
ncbi:MAG: hypothetical protein V7636_1625 [Actinomycetota bacterium]